MAARHRPPKCLYYYKGYCIRDKDVKKCNEVCKEYVHYDLDPKHKIKVLKAFSKKEEKTNG